MHTMEAPMPPHISYLFIVWQSAIHKRNVSKTSSKRMNTIHKFYGKRGAEKLLGIAPYTKEQLQDWYEERPRHGGDRKSDAFKKATGNRKE